MEREGWIDLAVAACDDAGIAHGPIDVLMTWDQTFSDSDAYRHSAVFRIGDHRCLKLYSPTSERRFHVERSVLQTLVNYSRAIPAPRVIAARARSHLPPYLIMTELSGSTLQASWETLTRSELLAIAREIGTITAAIHGLPQADLAAVERQFGGRHAYATLMQAERVAQIAATTQLSPRQRDAVLDYVFGEAQAFLEEPPNVTHSDFSHAHIYIAREPSAVQVAGVLDWAEAMLGPPEWDIAYHWFWTFSQDREAMRECLKTYYPDGQLPERLARRCLNTHLYSYSMGELWPSCAEKVGKTEWIVRELTAFFFPPDVFGPPD